MSYRTVEVELTDGQIRTLGREVLPAKARALLTIIEGFNAAIVSEAASTEAGLGHFLTAPDFPLTPEQFRASMEADFFEQ